MSAPAGAIIIKGIRVVRSVTFCEEGENEISPAHSLGSVYDIGHRTVQLLGLDVRYKSYFTTEATEPYDVGDVYSFRSLCEMMPADFVIPDKISLFDLEDFVVDARTESLESVALPPYVDS